MPGFKSIEEEFYDDIRKSQEEVQAVTYSISARDYYVDSPFEYPELKYKVRGRKLDRRQTQELSNLLNATGLSPEEAVALLKKIQKQKENKTKEKKDNRRAIIL